MTERPLDCIGLASSDGMRGKADFQTFGKSPMPDQVPVVVATNPSGYTIAELESLLASYDAARIAGFVPTRAIRQLIAVMRERDALVTILRTLDTNFGFERWNCEGCGHAEATAGCDNHLLVKQTLAKIDSGQFRAP